ncbi:hypothetical protein [Sphaerisporangium perillae]|uniref:hypothetical protein n=1 Tax=Sphaerisporangium perillae TaxID=2935860 RepID=UPI00200E691C|nr:hypothetical protein [Sphaerisporangium perillae]
MLADSYALPGQERLAHPELTRFGVYEDLERRARLMEGAWPRPQTGGTVEVALSQPAAQAMRLTTGQEFSLVGRLDHKAVRARLTGVFQLDDPFADRWGREELLRRGMERGGYTTYGPLMVPRETFLARFTGTSVTVSWVAVPDLRNLTRTGCGPSRPR